MFTQFLITHRQHHSQKGEAGSFITLAPHEAPPQSSFPVLSIQGVKQSDLQQVLKEQSLHLQSQGFDTLTLCIDHDGPLQKLLSPRQNPLTFETRLTLIKELFLVLKENTQIPGVALTVEELCPGGLDATDGIKVAQELVSLGAQFILASGGTNDFPALKNRRKTKHKEGRKEGLSVEPWLASPAWLLNRINKPILAQGIAQDVEHAKTLARKMGFAGLVLE